MWNPESGTILLVESEILNFGIAFSVFYSFIHFLDFWDPDKHAMLTARFDNAFKYFQFARPVRDPQFKVRSPMVHLDGCNQNGTCSGLPNKRCGTWWIASAPDFFSQGKRDFRLLGSIRLFNIGGWSEASRVTPYISTLLSLLANFSCFRPVFITLCSIMSALILVFTRECWDESKFLFWTLGLYKVLPTVDSRYLEPSREIEKSSSYREFEANNRR